MTPMIWTEEQLREYQKRTGLGEHTETPAAPKRAKYGNRKTEADGRIFDSKHEAEVYRDLLMLWKAGEILGVMCQVAFLLPGGVKYIADFVTLGKDGRYTVMDAKSEATRKDKTYRLKKRQMRECLGIEIAEV